MSTNADRICFDRVAAVYDEARPGYPESLFEDIIHISQLRPRSHILEVGCGTGQATVALARRNLWVECVELGPNLAATARKKLWRYPNVQIHVCDFESWSATASDFDLVGSGTAFHWVRPTIAYVKAADVLRSDGWIALFWNEHVRDENDAFETEVQHVYHTHAPELADAQRSVEVTQDGLADRSADLRVSERFRDVIRRGHRWLIVYTCAEYVRLLNTYSNHILLNDETRMRLHQTIASLIKSRFGGSVTKQYVSTLYMAQKK